MPCDKSCMNRAEDAHHHHIQQKTGRGPDPQDKGFRPGGRRSFDSWQVGVSIDSYFNNTAGYFRKVK
jgi:hypothetical protein